VIILLVLITKTGPVTRNACWPAMSALGTRRRFVTGYSVTDCQADWDDALARLGRVDHGLSAATVATARSSVSPATRLRTT
jgi:hypothetical protein